MNRPIDLSLCVVNYGGDFAAAIYLSNIEASITVTPAQAADIVNMAEALLLTTGSEISQPFSHEIWPVAALEEATGLTIDPNIFKTGRGTKLVVSKTSFHWRVVTEAFGVLETPALDLNVLKLRFNLILPFYQEGQSVKGDFLTWIQDLCSAGTFENVEEVDALREALNIVIFEIPMSRLRETASKLLKLASTSPEKGVSRFPALHAPSSDGEIEGAYLLLNFGRDIIAKIDGHS